MKYTDEQLSRILSAADAGGLKRFGQRDAPAFPCCMIQAAELRGEVSLETTTRDEWYAAVWFDRLPGETYRDPDAMLRALEEKGWA